MCRFVLAIAMCALAADRAWADAGGWYALPVPGGRATLARLGVADGRERAVVMIELIRRLHFPLKEETALTGALRDLARAPESAQSDLDLASPLPAETWSQVIFDRDIPASRLFVEILNDEHARLLFHGLAGLDAASREWMAGQRDLLRWLYRDDPTVRSFSLFAPALRIVNGSVIVPGGPAAEERWSALLGSAPRRADHFIRQLFERDAGRTAGLYFVASAVDEPRRMFLLGGHLPAPARDRAFRRLAAGFASCYPPRSTAYPFVLRSPDAALLLAELDLDTAGQPAGPRRRAFWQEVLGEAIRPGEDMTADLIDASWMVGVLCHALAEDRRAVFGTLLAGQRLFTDMTAADHADTIAALRSRRAYPALFMALEQAGLRKSRTFAAAARHASLLSQIDDAGRSLTALRQFQGALMLTLNATLAGTLTPEAAGTLVESLAAVPLRDGQYDGGIADWIAARWMETPAPSIRRPGASAEQIVAMALAGPEPDALRAVSWEGQAYVVDLAGSVRQRLLDIRARQGGVSLDTVLALHRTAQMLHDRALPAERVAALRTELETSARGLDAFVAANEYQGDAFNPAEVVTRAARDLGDPARAATEIKRVVDFLLAHVLPAWAYAPYLGGVDSGALVGGDGSLRHRLGVRAQGRDRTRLRWELAVSPAARGVITGSILGVQAGLASWSLRRLSSDSVPPPPSIDGNDVIPMTLTAAFSNPRRLTDADLAAIVAAQANGATLVGSARADPDRLTELAQRAAMSPWRRTMLPWMVQEEPDRIDEQFSATELARLGGMDMTRAPAWGTVSMAAQSLRLRAPQPWIPELFAGRAADGIVGGNGMEPMLRVTVLLGDLRLPAVLAAPVLSYAMRDYLDRVRPVHGADDAAFVRQARALSRQDVEDYVGALAAVGPLRPAVPR